MSNLRELQLRLAELYRLRDAYAARPRRDLMARYVDTLIANLQDEIASASGGPTEEDPELPLPPIDA